MKPIPKPLVWCLRGILVLPLVGMLGWSQWKDYKRSRVVSCTNHGHHIVLTMKVNAHEGADWEIPYLSGTEGHKLLVAFCIAEYGPNIGGFNCHHGASGFKRGGWQCVNLPKARWLELLDRLQSRDAPESRFHDGIPIFWCGRETGEIGTRERVCASVRWVRGQRWFDYGRIKEDKLIERLAWLNRQLADLGEPPVPLDIPPKVDWPAVIKWAEGVTNSFSKSGP